MNKMKIVQFISVGGILTSFTVLLQSAPVFLPAFGMILSPFSTLPIAIAAVCNIFLGITVLFSSSLILIIVSPQEAMILLFSTGLLGTVLGILIYRKPILISILASAIALSIGMIVLTYIAVIPAFVDLSDAISFPLIMLLFFIFSLVYASIWFICFRKFTNQLIKIKLIEKPDHYFIKFKSHR